MILMLISIVVCHKLCDKHILLCLFIFYRNLLVTCFGVDAVLSIVQVTHFASEIHKTNHFLPIFL